MPCLCNNSRLTSSFPHVPPVAARHPTHVCMYVHVHVGGRQADVRNARQPETLLHKHTNFQPSPASALSLVTGHPLGSREKLKRVRQGMLIFSPRRSSTAHAHLECPILFMRMSCRLATLVLPTRCWWLILRLLCTLPSDPAAPVQSRNTVTHSRHVMTIAITKISPLHRHRDLCRVFFWMFIVSGDGAKSPCAA